MASQPVDKHLDQIRETMQEKDTDELIAIWRRKDRSEWTEDAFKVVEAILTQRLGGLPEPAASVESSPAGGEEEPDTYHDPEEIDGICSRANTLATLALVLAFVFIGLAIIVFIGTLLITASPIENVLLLDIPMTLGILFLALLCGLANVILKAFEEGLYLLLDIESNTRLSHRG